MLVRGCKILAVVLSVCSFSAFGAKAATVNVGSLPTDGSTLTFFGDTSNDLFDVYNFTLPFNITGATGVFVHMETGNASYDTLIRLYSGFDLSGAILAADDDSGPTFGPCSGSNGLCSSIGAGDDPLQRTGGASPPLPLLAGNYSLEVEGFGSATGTYELRFTSANVSEVPLPGALPLFATGLGALGLLGWRRKRKQLAA